MGLEYSNNDAKIGTIGMFVVLNSTLVKNR